MFRYSCWLLLLLGFFALEGPARATTVSINTDAARAVLEALQNPALSHETSLQIAGMHGNQGILRKLNEFKIPATPQSFADALYASAHGAGVTDPIERSFYFDAVKPKSQALLLLIKQIEAKPLLFQGAIEPRIALFTPPDANIHLQGYIVAGGDGGGYTFGDTDFFLNLGMTDDFVLAKITTTHEMYHAVQGSFSAERELQITTSQGHTSHACANVEQLFTNLYEEGSATYVGDISLLPQSHSPTATRMQTDINDGMSHIHNSATLLEMSVIALNTTEPVPYDDLYEVGFLGPGVLYNIAYVMAKDIVESDGSQGLAALLKQPPYKFVLRYTQLPAYGLDEEHPRLGPNTIAAATRLASACK